MTDRERLLAFKKLDLTVVEGVAGTFYYHLAPATKTSVGLCGAKTMKTFIPLAGWGERTHLRERYCQTCERMGSASA